jgi:23S rRNA (adenine2503-C2)-methyltransferase
MRDLEEDIMKVFAAAGNDDVARVYLADFGEGRTIEFVESLQPPYPREEKWILMLSTLFGCPVQCLICDAGGSYKGKLTKEEMLVQIDYLIRQYYPDMKVPASKFKIQFARMGEPAFNMEVLDVLEELPTRYQAPGLMPSLSTIAPQSGRKFFQRLLEIKDRIYSGGRFQFQFSLHTTDEKLRDRLIPVKKWSFTQMAEYGQSFYQPGDRKITLNFALAAGMPLDPQVLLRYFHPDRYLIKITPVNPTCRVAQHGIESYVVPDRPETGETLAQSLVSSGYEVIVSIGEVEENLIGSNCGQYVLRYLNGEVPVKDGYTYLLEDLSSELSTC